MRTRIAALAALLALGVGCSAQDAGSAVVGPVAGAGAEAAPTEIVDFGDGFEHYVVITDQNTALGAAAPSAPSSASSSATPDGGDLTGDLPVRVGTERQVVTFTAGDLEAVVPNADEQATIDEAVGIGLVALVVVDLNGRAGTPGARYLWVGGELRSLATDAHPALEATPAAPRTDADVAADLLAVDGVVGVDVTGPGVLAVRADRELDPAATLATIDGVASAAPDVLFGTTDDPSQGLQWMLRNTGDGGQAQGAAGTPGVDTGAPYAWNVATGRGVTVAVIDSGVQLDHPDLSSQIAANAGDACGDRTDNDGNGYVDDCRGWDFGDGDNDPSPSPTASNQSHGTHVAGIIAAARNGVGVVGMAPDARVLPVKVGMSNGAIPMSALIAGIDYATARGADVINMSLATGTGVPRSAISSLETAVVNAGQHGVLVVAAAGNNGIDLTNNPIWPASYSDYYPFVLTVGASTNTGARASFSNYGSPMDVLAPGAAIYSTWTGGTLNWASGTSMAAPATAGAAAVVLSSRDLAPADVRTMLVSSGAPSGAGPRLDVAAAMGVSRDGEWSVTYSGADRLRADEAGALDLQVAGRLAGAAALRISVATLDDGAVAAVGGLAATVAGPGGTQFAVTDDTGAFPLLSAAGDLANGIGFQLSQLSLPAGRYALVTEMLTAAGARAGAIKVAYLDVGAASSSVDTTVPATTTPGAPATTTAPGGGATTTTTVPAPGTPTTVATTVPSNGGGSGGPTPLGPTTTIAGPPAGGGSGGGGSPETTLAPNPGVTTTTTPAGPSTTSPSGSPITTSTSTTVPAGSGGGAGGGGGGGVAPVPTTPTPPPDSSGAWSVTSMAPRLASIDGGTRLVIDGRFPTNVPVYVWFGQAAIVLADSYGDHLELTSPWVVGPMVTDVTIRFRTSVSVELTLAEAFTFAEPAAPGDGSGGGVGGGSGSTPTTVAGGGSGGGSTGGSGGGPGVTTTVAPAPGTSLVTTTTIASPSPSTTTPAGSPTTTTQPGATNTTVPSAPRTRGALVLRSVTSGSPLAGVSASRWPSTACGASCTATTL